MILFRTVLAILLVSGLSLTACVKADRESAEDNTISTFSNEQSLVNFNQRALFEAGKVNLTDIKFSHGGKSEWKQVDRIQLFFELCGIRDRAAQGTINGEKFHISSELGNSFAEKDKNNKSSIVTVSNNCLSWSQKVPVFNYLAPSFNLALHFEFESLAGGLGTVIRRVAFNPWDMYRNKSKTSGLSDLTDFARKDWHTGRWAVGEAEIIKALKGELIDGQARLELSSLSIEPIEREKERQEEYSKRLAQLSPKERENREKIDKALLNERGIQMSINMNAKPFVRVTDSTGVVHDETIDTGRFRVFMNLVASGASDDSKKYLLSNNVAAASGRNGSAFTWTMSPNGLLASVPMVLKKRTEFGRVELAVKIVPLDLKGVQPFMAVYDLGQYNQWVRKQSPNFKPEKHEAMTDVDYDAYIKASGGAPNNLATVRDAERFYFGPLKMRFVRIMPGETATDRTLMYSVTSCIKHGLYGSTVGPGLQFDITTDDKGRDHEIRRQTNENGCLTWFGFLSHQYYQKEVLAEKVAKVRFVGTKVDRNQWKDIINKYSKDFVYYMNAWDEKWTFGWDRPDMPDKYPQEIESQKQNAPASKLFIADFRYETMGFRYSIDKYLKLKVKKAVLLKAYPYVLKYNSIVLGRNATEKLRDGVYLMKIALQKDYLDPAAKGVRIYDTKSEDPLTLGEKAASHPIAEYEDQNVDHELLTNSQLKEGHKEYISIQQKLVRVLGGMIITPIEFEVSDLRLMRIRNQVFIQLQTIDEHKLRLASVIDQTLDEIYQDNNIEGRYKEVFKALEEIQDIRDQRIAIEAIKVNDEVTRAEVLRKLNQNNISLREAQDKLDAMMGLDKLDKNSDEYRSRKAILADKFARLDQFRELELSELAGFRNSKRSLTNRLIKSLGNQAQDLMANDWSKGFDEEYAQDFEKDPLQGLFFVGDSGNEKALQRILDYKINKARESGNSQQAEDLAVIRSADFTESPLAPNFSFDMLRNDGVEEGRSGLPSRTFVGPLTFVFNTNGSSLRPTDILNENYCTTAFCEVPKMIEQGVPPEKVEKSFKIDSENKFAQETGEPIFDSGDSVNANYENNKYYGYLKAYHGKTVDDLIEDKKGVEDRYQRKMEEGSQIINYVKTHKLRYVLLDDSDKRSHLKSVDHECAQNPNRPVERINSECFRDIHNESEDVLRANSLWGLINERRGRIDIEGEDEDQRYGLKPSYLSSSYGRVNGDVTPEDLRLIMEKGWKNSSLDPKISKKFIHRMCFALAQNYFSDQYFDKRITVKEKLMKSFTKNIMNKRSVGGLERLCHQFVDNMYGLTKEIKNSQLFPRGKDKPLPKHFSPVVLERKLRAYKTTNRYVYRGGKSLNINVATSFNLSNSTGIKVSTSSSIDNGSFPVVGKILKAIVGGLSLSRSTAKDEATGRTNGTTVSSGTFLVSQQATFDIELGEYERCLVARFHPAFIQTFKNKYKSLLKDNFNPLEDEESLGFLICTGKRERKCLPVKEKYYYFTQHFTEGDMLDTADLHNHPWLLELRGYRDFQVFAKTIGAKEVQHVDDGAWLKQVAAKTTTDALSFNLGASHGENKSPEYEVVNQEENMNWPIEELSRTYFEILPTFPGLYTYIDETGNNIREWPYENTDPGRAFNQCEQ